MNSCMCNFSCAVSLLEFHDAFIQRQPYLPTRDGAVCMLKHYLGGFDITCSLHLTDGILNPQLLPISFTTTNKNF